MLMCVRRRLRKSTYQGSTTSDCVSDGWTACSWCFTKTSASTLFGGHKWHNTVLSPCSIRSLQRNGRSSALLRNDYSITMKQLKHTAHVCPYGLAPRPWRAYSAFSRSKRTPEKPLPALSASLLGNTGGIANFRPSCCTLSVR